MKKSPVSFLAIPVLAFALVACSEVSETGASNGTGFSQPTQLQQARTFQGQNISSQGFVQQPKPISANAAQITALVNDPGFMSAVKGADRFTVASFYRARGFEPAWQDQGRWNIDAQAVHQQLASAGVEGLNPAHYLRPEMRASLPGGLDSQSLLQYDVHLTAGLLDFIADAKYGRFNENGGGADIEVLTAMLNQGYVAAYIRNLGPDNAEFQGLRNAMLTQGQSLTPDQRKKIALNMERARWTANQGTPHRLVRVNVAAAQLTAYENGNKAFDMPVVVGRQTRQTPIMNDRIVNLKYSPDWGVPKTVIEKDYLPRLRKDPSYLKKRGFQAFRGGKEVSFSSINFKDDHDYKRFTYRKAPGGENPLGGIRFSLTNSQSIFLHDAPGSSQFKAKDRAKSSGCVRVGDAAKLAQWVHAAQGETISRENIKSKMRLSEPKFVRLGVPIDVQLTYMTAWTDDEGKVQFAPDIYGLDKALAARMGSTS